MDIASHSWNQVGPCEKEITHQVTRDPIDIFSDFSLKSEDHPWKEIGLILKVGNMSFNAFDNCMMTDTEEISELKYKIYSIGNKIFIKGDNHDDKTNTNIEILTMDGKNIYSANFNFSTSIEINPDIQNRPTILFTRLIKGNHTYVQKVFLEN